MDLAIRSQMMFIIISMFIKDVNGAYWSLIRQPYILPGATMKTIEETISGRDCIMKCAEVNCGYIAMAPQDWKDFEKNGRIPGIVFNQRLERTMLKLCLIFDLRSAGGKVATAGYLAKGVEMVGEEGERIVGQWLLAMRIWERAEGGFNAEDFAPPQSCIDTLIFLDKELEREFLEAAPPTSCPARGSALSSHQPSTHEDSDDTTTEGEDEHYEEDTTTAEENTDEADYEGTTYQFTWTTEGAHDEDEETTTEDATTTAGEDEDFEEDNTTVDQTTADEGSEESTQFDVTTEGVTDEEEIITEDATTAQSVSAETTTEEDSDENLLESEQPVVASTAMIDDDEATSAPTTTTTSSTTKKPTTTTDEILETSATEESSTKTETTVESDATTTGMIADRTTTEGWPVKMQYSYWCEERVYNRFDINCATKSAFVIVENAFAPYLTENLKGCEMVGFRDSGMPRLTEATETKPAKAWCAKSKCGGMNIPLAYEYSEHPMAHEGQVYQSQTSTKSPLLCYVYSSVNKV